MLKFGKSDPLLWIFCKKWNPCLRISCKKPYTFWWNIPIHVGLKMWVPLLGLSADNCCKWPMYAPSRKKSHKLSTYVASPNVIKSNAQIRHKELTHCVPKTQEFSLRFLLEMRCCFIAIGLNSWINIAIDDFVLACIQTNKAKFRRNIAG